MFGAGYPSLPTVSLEEFYQQEYEEQVEQHKRFVLKECNWLSDMHKISNKNFLERNLKSPSHGSLMMKRR